MKKRILSLLLSAALVFAPADITPNGIVKPVHQRIHYGRIHLAAVNVLWSVTVTVSSFVSPQAARH